MLVKLTEVCGTGAVTNGRRYSLREVFVNPEHVVMVREEQWQAISYFINQKLKKMTRNMIIEYVISIKVTL